MDIKQEINKLKCKLLSTEENTLSEKNSSTFSDIKNILLDTKVDNYIEWNFLNMVKGNYTDIGEYWMPIQLRNFIEKMAVWYELRYPDYEINRLMHSSSQEEIKVSDIMFNKNTYINDLLDENSSVKALDWDEFYNTSAFINSLSLEEKYIFQKEKYKSLVYVDRMDDKCKNAHLHLTEDGFVKSSYNFDLYTNFKITNQKLVGMHIKDVINLLKENNITLPDNNELEEAINKVLKWTKQKEGLLDAVMYRIIERGGNRIGPRRGFLFAKEFKRNIDIPMMYAIDFSDPGLRLFINEYIKAGGSKDLVCYIGYFSRTNETKKLDTISIQELILTLNNNAMSFYTEEETKLHQRLVNTLVSQSNQKENVKQLRLERKLKKSKKNR